MKIRSLLSFTTIALLSTTLSAQAALLDGKTIKSEYLYPNTSTVNGWYGSGTYVVGAGVEANAMNIATDYSDTNIMIDFNFSGQWSDATFNGFHFFDVNNTIDDFTSVSLNSLSNMTGLSQSAISFDANNIWLNWQDLNFSTSTVVSIDIGAAQSNVPEPDSIALLGLGVAGLALARRRKLA